MSSWKRVWQNHACVGIPEGTSKLGQSVKLPNKRIKAWKTPQGTYFQIKQLIASEHLVLSQAYHISDATLAAMMALALYKGAK